jgi:hypothetical protein
MTTTAIDPVLYWKLRALSAELEAAQAMATLAQARLELARKHRAACWAEVANQYDLSPTRPYGLIDDSCSLVEATTA